MLLRGWRNVLFRRFAWFNLNLVALFLVDALALSEALGQTLGYGARAVVSSLLPATCVSFFVGFSSEPSRRSDALRRAAVGLTLVLLATTLAGWPASADARQWTLFGGVAVALTLSIGQLVIRYRGLESRLDQVRLKYVAVAGAVVFALLLLEYVPGLQVTSAGNILTALYMFFLFQVVTRRRVIDVFEFLGRFAALGGFAVVLALIYVVLVGWWRHDFGLFVFNTAIATVVMLILFDPLRALVESRITEFVFREKFEFTRHVEELRRGLAKIIDVNELADAIMDLLLRSRRVTHASLYLFEEGGLTFRCIGKIGETPGQLDAIQHRPFLDRLAEDKLLAVENLQAERDELNKRGAVEDQGQIEVLDTVLATLAELPSSLSIGLLSGDQLIGVLSVNDERLREAYATDEIKALVALAGQSAIVVENSRLFDRLRERDRLAALGEMAAGLAHEIRNPLGAIKGAAQLLLEEQSTGRAVYMGVIVEEVERLNGVVSQFLTYARPMKGGAELVDVNRTLERTLTLLGVEEHASQIEFIGAPNLPNTRADAELLRQVTLNLARNAIEAMGVEGGRLTISTSLTRRRASGATGRAWLRDQVTFIQIRFEDTGPGMPPEVIDRLFIPFFTTKQGGTGLGLAICDRIMRSLGGSIEVTSRLGEGSVFTLYVPVSEVARASTA